MSLISQFHTALPNVAGKKLSDLTIGVLALQGDSREHLHALTLLGAHAIEVKRADELSSVDALVIPGGESTTISKLLHLFNLFDLLRDRIHDGLPVYGSCAGMIMLATSIVDPASGQECLGAIDIQVERNAFGRQVDSFESDLTIDGIAGEPVRAVFIRAPWVDSAGPEVEVLASVTIDGIAHPVAVRQKKALATSFHPELTGDLRIHRYFLEEVVGVDI
jgi:5'-phosphate synthase pdxT subunit